MLNSILKKKESQCINDKKKCCEQIDECELMKIQKKI